MLKTYKYQEINRMCISKTNFSILSLHSKNTNIQDTLIDCIRRMDIMVFIGKVIITSYFFKNIKIVKKNNT